MLNVAIDVVQGILICFCPILNSNMNVLRAYTIKHIWWLHWSPTQSILPFQIMKIQDLSVNIFSPCRPYAVGWVGGFWGTTSCNGNSENGVFMSVCEEIFHMKMIYEASTVVYREHWDETGRSNRIRYRQTERMQHR